MSDGCSHMIQAPGLEGNPKACIKCEWRPDNCARSSAPPNLCSFLNGQTRCRTSCVGLGNCWGLLAISMYNSPISVESLLRLMHETANHWQNSSPIWRPNGTRSMGSY